MYKLIALLVFLIAALQYRLWLGDGGILEYHELQVKLAELGREGERRQARNAALEADVKDLKDGQEAIEERARMELGMIRQGETFVQVFKTSEIKPRPAPPETAVAKPGKTGSTKTDSRRP